MPKSESQMEKFTSPLKLTIKEILRNKIKTKEDRLALAKFLGGNKTPKSDSHVQKLLYDSNYGGFEALVCSLFYSLGIESPPTTEQVEGLIYSLLKEHPIEEADRVWFRLPLDKRVYYSRLIKFIGTEDS